MRIWPTNTIEYRPKIKLTQHNKTEIVAGLVWLSLFMNGSVKCKLPSVAPSTSLSRIQHLISGCSVWPVSIHVLVAKANNFHFWKRVKDKIYNEFDIIMWYSTFFSKQFFLHFNACMYLCMLYLYMGISNWKIWMWYRKYFFQTKIVNILEI